MLTYLQEKLIFLSEELPKEHKFKFKTNFKELFLKANDGAIIHGIHFLREKPKGIILYFHGNKDTIDCWGYWGEQLASTYNYDVVMMDYRGYGKSAGVRSFKSMLSDCFLFYKYCMEHFSENEIIIFGRSLGGAFASHTALKTNPKKLILESTFTQIKEVAKMKFWNLPVGIILKYPFQSDKNVQHITNETYIIHGTDDELVKYKLGEELYRLSISNKKKLFTIKGGLHNDLTDYEAYFKALDEILK